MRLPIPRRSPDHGRIGKGFFCCSYCFAATSEYALYVFSAEASRPSLSISSLTSHELASPKCIQSRAVHSHNNQGAVLDPE